MKQLSASDVGVATTFTVAAHPWRPEGLHQPSEQVGMKVTPAEMGSFT